MDQTLKITSIILCLLISNYTLAYEQAFSKTPVGKVEVRTLPSARLLITETDGTYFDQADNLFRKLFNYIKDNDIAMTIPVEGNLDRGSMRFYLGKEITRALNDNENVRVENYPTRKVVSMGAKGSYSEKNVMQTHERLKNWLENNQIWESAGEPYAVYWNGPFTLWFLKRYEVHIPIKAINRTIKPNESQSSLFNYHKPTTNRLSLIM